jgi:hypothetical protein
MVSGRLPDPWPDTLIGHRLAHEGRAAEAAAEFSGKDPADVYNRWVLQPESTPADSVRSALPSSYAALVDVVSYSAGMSDQAPEAEQGQAPEVAALVLATQATVLLERNEAGGAVDLLHHAADLVPGTALAAVLLGNAGTLARQHDVHRERARHDLLAAVDALAGTDLVVERAELCYQLGSLCHEEAAAGRGDERALLQEAMGHYYEVLQRVDETGAPYLWASTQLNLATAHLASPMTQASDQLRLGIATQSLRASRRVFSAQEHPGPWSTATLNLANALVYTPSTHQADNLVEAVELYQEVLDSGVRDGDALGRARVLANLGNVLAHLGMFDPAKAALVEARFVFEEHLDHDSAMSVRGILDEIARSAVLNSSDDADEDLAALARQAEQMSRMPVGDFTGSGMGVHVQPRPEAKVTVLARRPAGTRPASEPPHGEDGSSS